MSRTDFMNAANEIVRRPSVEVNITDIAEVTVTAFEHDSKNFDGFCIGNAVPQTLNFSVQGDMTDSLSNGKAVNITYFMGNVDSGCICPEFYITSYSYDAGSNTTKIVAKDGLYFLAEKKYPVSAGSLMTVGEYFESFCAGLGFGSQMLGGGLYSLPYPSGDAAANFSESDNALTVLRRVAEACCCNAYAGKGEYTDDNGEPVIRNIIVLSPYNSKNQAVLTLNSVSDFTVSADTVPINRVVLSRGDVNDNVYLPETDPENISEIVITNNPILDNLNPKILDYDSRNEYKQSLYDYFNGQSLISYSLDFKGNPGLLCGDVIRVCDRNGKYHNVVYFGSKLTFNNGMSADVTIEYNPTNTNSYSSGRSLQDALRYAGIQVDKVNAVITSLVSETLPVVKKSYIVDLSAGMYAINVASNKIPVLSGSIDVMVSVRLGDTEITDFDVSVSDSHPGIAVNIDNDKITFSWDATTAIDDVITYAVNVEIKSSEDDVATLIIKKFSLIAVQNGDIPYIRDGIWHIGDEDTGVKADYAEDIDDLRLSMTEQHTDIMQNAEKLVFEAVADYAGRDPNGNVISLQESVTQLIDNSEILYEYKKTVDGLQESVDEQFENLRAYLRWGALNETGNEVGLEMGVSDSVIKVRLVNDKLVFYSGSFRGTDADNVIQCIDAKTRSAKLGNTLQYGDEWEHGVDSEGNFYHAYIGGEF